VSVITQNNAGLHKSLNFSPMTLSWYSGPFAWPPTILKKKKKKKKKMILFINCFILLTPLGNKYISAKNTLFDKQIV